MAEILREITGGKWGWIYRFDAYFEVFEQGGARGRQAWISPEEATPAEAHVLFHLSS